MSQSVAGMGVVVADNPSPMTGRGTNTYVLDGGGAVAVIDPGPDDREHLRRVADTAAARGPIAIVLLTHHHPDHSAGAREFATMVHAPLAAIKHRYSPPLDRELSSNDVVPFGTDALSVVHTPGHCRDHACFVWAARGAVFAGDLVAGEGYIVISPPDGNMADYLDSLERIAAIKPEVLLPGHGPAIASPVDYLRMYIKHRLDREAKVVAALRDRPRSALGLLPRVYDDTPRLMYPIAARSLRAHLEKLIADGRVKKEGRRYQLT